MNSLNTNANATHLSPSAVNQALSSSSYVFELFVCGMTRKSLRTIIKVKTVLDHELLGNYKLEVIDIFKNPMQTQKRQIMTTPTLIKKLPLPTQQIAGDITGKDRILCGLNIKPKDQTVGT